MSRFRAPEAYQARSAEWELLPFRFERMDDRVLVTNMVGEHLFLAEEEFELLGSRRLPVDSLVRRLRAKHVIREAGDELPLELLALKARTRYRRLPEFTALHILVVSLRCEHSCPYCQVSRQSSDNGGLRHVPETAARRSTRAFRSPSHAIKIEFQGGEPLLNFELIEEVVLEAEAPNPLGGEEPRLRDRHQPGAARRRGARVLPRHDVYISTSLDGPADLHNKNRPRPGGNSWELAIGRDPAGARGSSASTGSRP